MEALKAEEQSGSEGNILFFKRLRVMTLYSGLTPNFPLASAKDPKNESSVREKGVSPSPLQSPVYQLDHIYPPVPQLIPGFRSNELTTP
jgi:hypothetical protein